VFALPFRREPVLFAVTLFGIRSQPIRQEAPAASEEHIGAHVEDAKEISRLNGSRGFFEGGDEHDRAVAPRDETRPGLVETHA
jgi:hypothetical protein